MAITYRCECGKTLKAKDDAAGRKSRCPVCHREFVVPGVFDDLDNLTVEAVLPPPPLPTDDVGTKPPLTAVSLAQPTSTSRATGKIPLGNIQIVFACLLMAFCALMVVGGIVDSNSHHYYGSRFQSDNAYGAAANAAETIELAVKQPWPALWIIAFSVLWLIVAVNQLRRTIHDWLARATPHG
jgi:hypothetical protein